jgi:ketosteroid isomerase-like protein
MSEANVDVVRRGLAAFNDKDWEKSVQLMDPDVEWHDAPDLPGAQVHRGRDAVLAQWRDMRDALAEFGVEPERFFEVGDRVVVFLRSRGRGRTSGIEVSREIAQVFTVRDGLVAKVVGYDDRSKALEAVGLSEHDV